MDKAVLGFSGGVDSSVAALLLMDAGYEVTGLYLDTGGATAVSEVRESAEKLGFPLKVLDARAALEKHVCRPFAEGYLRGETPNPCVMCNPEVKFASLLACADEIGAGYIATGHYVRSEAGALYMGRPANDQSYMLCRLKKEQAARFIAPLGAYEKTEVRSIVEARGVPAAHKKDSMEICFIPDKDYAAWLSRRGAVPPPGELIYNGEVVGRHEGIQHYTLGQRRGLKFAAGRKVYVSEIDAENNRVVLSDGEGLFVTETRARDVSWLIDAPSAPFTCDVRVRHSKALYPALVTPLGGDIRMEFASPVRAPTRGQAAALYDGERLLGGGYIV